MKRNLRVRKNLLALVIVSPAGERSLAKFEKSVLLDTVRQSIALQSGTVKSRVNLYKFGLKLDPRLTLSNCGLANGDIVNLLFEDDSEARVIHEKVFCIGLFKTGTSSLSRALSLLGYKSYHRFGERFNVDWEDYWQIDNSNAFSVYYNDIKEFVTNYDAFADAPWMYLYRELDRWYPGSKFILTTRNKDRLADSEIAQCIRNNSIPDSAQRYINRYSRHNENVINYFKKRPQDLLIMDVHTGWPDLCNFLDIDIPVRAFPHENKRPDTANQETTNDHD